MPPDTASRVPARARTAVQLALLAVAVSVAAVFGVACEGPPDAHPPRRSARCAGCHMQDYLDATDPVHVKVKPTTCAVCHTQDAWHPHVTHHRWKLTGAHAHGHCFYCHDGHPPEFEGTPKECVGCHQDDYDKAGFPGHSRFPTTCADCHDTVTWATATYEVGIEPDDDARWDSGIPEGEELVPDAGPEGVDAGTRRRRHHTPDIVTRPSRR